MIGLFTPGRRAGSRRVTGRDVTRPAGDAGYVLSPLVRWCRWAPRNLCPGQRRPGPTRCRRVCTRLSVAPRVCRSDTASLLEALSVAPRDTSLEEPRVSSRHESNFPHSRVGLARRSDRHAPLRAESLAPTATFTRRTPPPSSQSLSRCKPPSTPNPQPTPSTHRFQPNYSTLIAGGTSRAALIQVAAARLRLLARSTALMAA